MSTGTSSPPNFTRPPVIEVVCGITFKSLEQFLAPYAGEFWRGLRGDYPKCQEHPPLSQTIERFERPGERRAPDYEFTVPLLPRVWFVSEDGTRVLQIQRDRFLHNWRKTKDQDEYPRYPRVIAMFRDLYSRFEAFVSSEKLGAIEPLQYELTYMNHVPKGEGWTSPGDLGRVLPDFAWRQRPGPFLPQPESSNWRVSFVLPDHSGRLRITAQNATRVADQKEVIQIDLTARGMPGDSSKEAMFKWFDMAREWIVRGFVDITGPEAQDKHWGRIP